MIAAKKTKKTYPFEVGAMVGIDLENDTDAGVELYRIDEADATNSEHEEWLLAILTPAVLKDWENPAFQMEQGHSMQQVKLSRRNLIHLKSILRGFNLQSDEPTTDYKIKDL